MTARPTGSTPGLPLGACETSHDSSPLCRCTPVGWGRRGMLSLLAALAILASTGTPATAAPSEPAGSGRPSWVPLTARLTFIDEFDDPSTLSTRWGTCYPWAETGPGCTNAGNHERQWYLPRQVRVVNGALNLTAERVSTVAGSAVYPYRSGMVTTAHRFELTYGYVEFRARIPRGQAMWPALWLLPRSYRWPPEIDVMEAVGQRPTGMSMTMHAADGSRPQQLLGGIDLSSGWHTFGIAWRRGVLTWYVDGVERFRV